ncbi:MmgE/PrpD family protein [Sneathiella sp.]|uniref:MmgE/PrpD family protein n=1 Tax=Sneathiella sp. TaxID=1964365 RepID=UPI00356191D4
MTSVAPITRRIAKFISELNTDLLPADLIDYAKLLAFDGIGVLASATHYSVTASSGMGSFAKTHGGAGVATLIGQGVKVDVVNAVFANGTLGYASDFEPHHPEAILHPIAVMIPTALALCESNQKSGREFLTAVILGCEITYRVSMALGPRELYDLGFHPSAVAGCFGAASAAAYLLDLNEEQCVATLGLAGLQASGMLAWQDDPREDARPFQMGMAARNGVTAALLAQSGFGAPDRIFDGGHNFLKAYSRVGNPDPLTANLGLVWDGVLKLAIKPFPCVSFLHPALDALESLLTDYSLTSDDVLSIDLRFPDAGAHCVDDNPLKGHSAQYILPVRVAMGRLSYLDLFTDRRLENEEVARLAKNTTVTRDFGEFNDKFPEFYIGEITLNLADGRTVKRRGDTARGYPENPLSQVDLDKKFNTVVGEVASLERREKLEAHARKIFDAESVDRLASLLAAIPQENEK